jgi:phytanoyl-CoA hydroxylase
LIDPAEARFERDGFEILSDRLAPNLIQELTLEINEFIDSYDIEGEQQILRRDHEDRGNLETFLRSATRVHGFLEAEAIDEHGSLRVPRAYALNKLGHALHDHLPAFNKLARSAITRAAFTAGGFSEAEIDQSMVIFKPPHIGGDVQWHQDATYLRTTPSRVLGVWFALEDATKENGCLWMAPGQHRSPLRERYVVDWQTRNG